MLFISKFKKVFAGVFFGFLLTSFAIAVPVGVTLSSSKKENASQAAVVSDPEPDPMPVPDPSPAPDPEPDPVPEPEPQPLPEPSQLLILAGGQSNMAGGSITKDPKNINTYSFSEKTPVYYSPYKATSVPYMGVWQLSQPAGQLFSAADGAGFFNIAKGIAFKQAELGKYKKIWVINTAVPGTGFLVYQAQEGNGNLTPMGKAFQVDAALQGINANPELKSKLQSGECEVVMTWLQGEAETLVASTEEQADLYADIVAGYLTTIRERLPVPDRAIVPIVVGGLQPEWVVTQSAYPSTWPVSQRKLIQKVIKDIPNRISHAAYADPTGIPKSEQPLNNLIHYGLLQLGWMADKYIEAFQIARAVELPSESATSKKEERVFAQFTSVLGEDATSFKQPQNLRWTTFTTKNWPSSISLNTPAPAEAQSNSLIQNFSNLRKTYQLVSGDADRRRKYRYRIDFYGPRLSDPYLSVQFVQSVNPIFYGIFADTREDYFEVESVVVQDPKKPGNIPSFTKENLAIGALKAVAVDPKTKISTDTPSQYAFLMSYKGSDTLVGFPVAGDPTSKLGVLKSKDNTLSWDFSHVVLSALKK